MLYDEIIIKYVQSGLYKNLEFLVKNLEEDDEVKQETDRRKVLLYKFIVDLQKQIDVFLESPEDDPRNNQSDDIFGDDDIAVSPNGTSTAFVDPPQEGLPPEFPPDEDSEDEEDEEE